MISLREDTFVRTRPMIATLASKSAVVIFEGEEPVLA